MDEIIPSEEDIICENTPEGMHTLLV